VENLDEKAFLIAFGKNLRRLRKEKGFTQEELANEADIEISQISRIERGVINTSVFNVYSITHILEISPSDLFILTSSDS
jgi:transcriptional regulator with XRE-family HTH domain